MHKIFLYGTVTFEIIFAPDIIKLLQLWYLNVTSLPSKNERIRKNEEKPEGNINPTKYYNIK